MTKLALIVAVAKDGTIGDRNTMPWHLPTDLKWFVKQTKGRPVVMGRRTFESLGKPLPNRRNIVLTRSSEWSANGVEVVRSPEEAIALGSGEGVDSLMIIGGAEVFSQFEPLADAAYVTLIDGVFNGDTRYYPPLDWVSQKGEGWECVTKNVVPPDDKNAYGMTFFELKRVPVDSSLVAESRLFE